MHAHLIGQGGGEVRQKWTSIWEVLTYAPSPTIAHAYLRSSCTSIRLSALPVPSDCTKFTTHLMDTIVTRHSSRMRVQVFVRARRSRW